MNQTGMTPELLEKPFKEKDVAGRFFTPITAISGEFQLTQVLLKRIDLEGCQRIEVAPIRCGTQCLGLYGNCRDLWMTGKNL